MSVSPQIRKQPRPSLAPLYTLPLQYYSVPPDRSDQLSPGDREALSTMIAAFTFTPRTYDLMRFITALSSTIQAYLVKRNRYGDYAPVFRDISQHITNARLLLDSPRDQGRATAILYSLETALKIIAEREGLTQTGAAMYDGKMPIAPTSEHSPTTEDDPYGV